MGLGNSRKWYVHQSEKPSSFARHSGPGGEKHRPSIFRRRRSITTAPAAIPTMVQPMARRALYGSYSAMRPMPQMSQMPQTYTPMQQMSPSYMPIRYNNYASPSYIQPQPMMMQQQRAAPAMPQSYMALPSPSMSTPYMQQPQIQPAYNNAQAQAPLPASMSGGTGSYPLSYPSQPGRLITDWTGGGKISPGFLGPPI
ncbi:unnamed protein product [Adineta steineri]|uniref:Uncharacterized protein n=1 Tax=Adineta steineri TaxID=433720 RepID=A0A818NWK5_9BILA|nr:unnamed protein product [Adineta steineri]CAF0875337.1 unnamed protein product [Adineta steineri]CAF0888844.1 unnamed protein product [Adineta steineri]CAF3545900.1 unnamed protein product [Adineta steineri]CAF3613603.1 unnamed protein product [Adineta steineri]